MSAVGTKRTCRALWRMSAIEVLNGLCADIASGQLIAWLCVLFLRSQPCEGQGQGGGYAAR
jgi:hypothetical protein